MYNPVVGRWISPDPIGMENGDPEIVYSHEYVARRLRDQLRAVSASPEFANSLYAYVSNNVLNSVDPSGLAACKVRISSTHTDKKGNVTFMEDLERSEECVLRQIYLIYPGKKLRTGTIERRYSWKKTDTGAFAEWCLKSEPKNCNEREMQCVQEECCQTCLPMYRDYFIIEQKVRPNRHFYRRTDYSCVSCECPNQPAVAPKPPAVAPKP